MYKSQTIIKSYDITMAKRLLRRLGTLAQVEIVGSLFRPHNIYEDIRVIVYDHRVKELVHKHLNVECEWEELT